MNPKRRSEKRNVRIFLITLSRSNLSAPAQNEDGRPSMLNLRREIQGQIIVRKTLFHRSHYTVYLEWPLAECINTRTPLLKGCAGERIGTRYLRP